MTHLGRLTAAALLSACAHSAAPLPVFVAAAEVTPFAAEIVALVRRELPSARIAFVSIKPSPSRWALVEQVRAANQLVRDEIARDPLSTYVDTFTPMLRADGRPRPELFGPDSLHMVRAGYVLWRETITPVIH